MDGRMDFRWDVPGGNSNDSGGSGGGPNAGGVRPSPSPTGSAGSRSMSPAIGNQNIPVPPRPSSNQSEGGGPPRMSQSPMPGNYPGQQSMAPPPHHGYPPGGKMNHPNAGMIPPGHPPPPSPQHYAQQSQQHAWQQHAQQQGYGGRPPHHGGMMSPYPPPPSQQQMPPNNYAPPRHPVPNHVGSGGPPQNQYSPYPPSGYGGPQQPSSQQAPPSWASPTPTGYGGPQPGWSQQAPQPWGANPTPPGPGQSPNPNSRSHPLYLKQQLQQKMGFSSPPHGQGYGPMGPPPASNMSSSSPSQTPPPPPGPGGHGQPPQQRHGPPPPHFGGPPGLPSDQGDNSNSNSNSGANPPNIVSVGPDGTNVDDVSQQSTLSSTSGASGGDDGPAMPKLRKETVGHQNYASRPATPQNNAVPSPGTASMSSAHEEYGEMNSPGWPRTPASPGLNSHPPPPSEQYKPKSKKPDSLQKMYDMDENPDRRGFLDKLMQFMDEHNTPIIACPTISKTPLDLFRLYFLVKERGGFLEVTKNKTWKDIAGSLGIGASSSAAYTLRKHYTKHLLPFECKFDRGGIDPQPLINQVETPSKKKGPKVAPVPSPGSSNSQDSFQGANNNSQSSIDGFNNMPTPSGGSGPPYGVRPPPSEYNQQSNSGPPTSISGGGSGSNSSPTNSTSPLARPPTQSPGHPPPPQAAGTPPHPHSGEKTLISVSNPFDDLQQSQPSILPIQQQFQFPQFNHNQQPPMQLMSSRPNFHHHFSQYASLTTTPPCAAASSPGYQGPPGSYPPYASPSGDQYPGRQPHEAYNQQGYGGPGGYPPPGRPMYPYPETSSAGGTPPTQSIYPQQGPSPHQYQQPPNQQPPTSVASGASNSTSGSDDRYNMGPPPSGPPTAPSPHGPPVNYPGYPPGGAGAGPHQGRMQGYPPGSGGPPNSYPNQEYYHSQAPPNEQGYSPMSGQPGAPQPPPGAGKHMPPPHINQRRLDYPGGSQSASPGSQPYPGYSPQGQPPPQRMPSYDGQGGKGGYMYPPAASGSSNSGGGGRDHGSGTPSRSSPSPSPSSLQSSAGSHHHAIMNQNSSTSSSSSSSSSLPPPPNQAQTPTLHNALNKPPWIPPEGWPGSSGQYPPHQRYTPGPPNAGPGAPHHGAPPPGHPSGPPNAGPGAPHHGTPPLGHPSGPPNAGPGVPHHGTPPPGHPSGPPNAGPGASHHGTPPPGHPAGPPNAGPGAPPHHHGIPPPGHPSGPSNAGPGIPHHGISPPGHPSGPPNAGPGVPHHGSPPPGQPPTPAQTPPAGVPQSTPPPSWPGSNSSPQVSPVRGNARGPPSGSVIPPSGANSGGQWSQHGPPPPDHASRYGAGGPPPQGAPPPGALPPGSQQQPPWTPPNAQGRGNQQPRPPFPVPGKNDMYRGGYGSSGGVMMPPSGVTSGPPHPPPPGAKALPPPNSSAMPPQPGAPSPQQSAAFPPALQIPSQGAAAGLPLPAVPPPVPVKKEIVFPPDSVEAVTPVLSRRKKLRKNDVAPVEAWRIMMCLKSGLLAETTWALDVLNVLLYDDHSISYFSLTYLPGLSDLLLEHLRRALYLIFGNSIGIEATGDKTDDEPSKNQEKEMKWYEVEEKTEEDEPDIGTPRRKYPRDGHRTLVLQGSTNYTMVSRIGRKTVGMVSKDDEPFVLPGPRDWDAEEKWRVLRENNQTHAAATISSDSTLDPSVQNGVGGLMELTKHVVTSFTADLNIVPLVRVVKPETAETRNRLKRKGKSSSCEGAEHTEQLVAEIKQEPQDCHGEGNEQEEELNLDLYRCETKMPNEVNVPIKSSSNSNSSNIKRLLAENNSSSNSSSSSSSNSTANNIGNKTESSPMDTCSTRIKLEISKEDNGETGADDEEKPVNGLDDSDEACSAEETSVVNGGIGVDISRDKNSSGDEEMAVAGGEENSSVSRATADNNSCDEGTSSEDATMENNLRNCVKIGSIYVQDYGSTLKRKKIEDFEDECYTRDEPSLYQVTETQDALARRCLSIFNILRNLTFVPGNDVEFGKSIPLLSLLGKLILIQHEHPLKREPASKKLKLETEMNGDSETSTDEVPTKETKEGENGTDKEEKPETEENGHDSVVKSSSGAVVNGVDIDSESCTSLSADNEWWWEYVHYLREHVLVMIANISGQMDLSQFSEEISRPILDGLLHWAVCPAADGHDPFPTLGPNSVLSPQRLAIEALCKLSVTQGNIDLLLATPPYSRIERLCQLLCRSLCPSEDQVMREFAINLLSYLSAADSGVARTIALQNPCCISLLISFIEQAEVNANNISINHGFQVLRDNPEAMGTSLDMLRRAATTLFNLARHPDNRALFVQHEPRLLSLVMSHILEQKVAAIVAQVLFQCSAPDSASSKYLLHANSSHYDTFYSISRSRRAFTQGIGIKS